MIEVIDDVSANKARPQKPSVGGNNVEQFWGAMTVDRQPKGNLTLRCSGQRP